eukprot:3642422-Prymnesium_polylepis.1
MPDDGTNPYIYPAILTFAAAVRVADRPCGERPRARGARHHLRPRGSRPRAASSRSVFDAAELKASM